jgi:hypothetical protein
MLCEVRQDVEDLRLDRNLVTVPTEDDSIQVELTTPEPEYHRRSPSSAASASLNTQRLLGE